MSELLNQLNDEELDFTVRFTDTDGEYGEYEFLDIVLYNGCEYAVVAPEDADGYVDIFRIMAVNGKEVYVRITDDMFDNDALIVENSQAKEVIICDKNKTAYLKVKFCAELFGLWSPAKKKAPFVCIEPWYGRCDSNDFNGEFSQKDYIINLNPDQQFNASYEIELL